MIFLCLCNFNFEQVNNAVIESPFRGEILLKCSIILPCDWQINMSHDQQKGDLILVHLRNVSNHVSLHSPCNHSEHLGQSSDLPSDVCRRGNMLR